MHGAIRTYLFEQPDDFASVKIVVIGANGFGKLHLASLARMDVEIEIFSRNQSSIDELSEQYDIAKSYTDINEALASDAEVADIILPHNMHRDIAIKAMRCGKHVLVEKPIATELSDAEEMIAESVKNRVKLMVAEQYYFDSTARWITDALRGKKIGDLHALIIRDQRLYSGHGWRTKASVMGGGALVDGGIHYIDALLNFGGPYSGVKSYVSKGASSIEEEDTTAALFRFRNGATGIFFYSWSYANPARVPSFELIGTKGSVVEDLETKPRVDFKYMTGVRHAFGRPVLNGQTVDIAIEDAFDSEIRGFLDSVKNNSDVPFPPELALRDLRGVKDIQHAASA